MSIRMPQSSSCAFSMSPVTNSTDPPCVAAEAEAEAEADADADADAEAAAVFLAIIPPIVVGAFFPPALVAPIPGTEVNFTGANCLAREMDMVDKLSRICGEGCRTKFRKPLFVWLVWMV